MYNRKFECKLKSMPHAQCKVLIEPYEFGISVTLRTYATDVVALQFVNGELKNVWFGAVNYSPTIARQVNKFSTEWLGWNAYHYAKAHMGLDWLDDIDNTAREQTKRRASHTLSAYLREVV